MDKQGIRNVELASTLNEHAQTIGAIIKGKRRVNAQLSIKLGKQFNTTPEYFILLQACYDIKNYQSANPQKTPDLSKLRRILFWDTNMESIDWVKYKDSVIKRVFQRGNEKEKQEIIRFYGAQTVKDILNDTDNSYYTIY